jgi:hypothetical protein
MSDYNWEIKFLIEDLAGRRKQLHRLELVLQADVADSESAVSRLIEAQQLIQGVEDALDEARQLLPAAAKA